MKIAEIEIPIYNQKVQILCCTRDRATKYLQQKYHCTVEGVDKTADGFTIMIEGDIYMWFTKDPDISIIIHEATHCTFELCKNIGIDINDQEAFCYLVEYICVNLWNIIQHT